MVGPDDLRGLFQPMILCCSLALNERAGQSHFSDVILVPLVRLQTCILIRLSELCQA